MRPTSSVLPTHIPQSSLMQQSEVSDKKSPIIIRRGSDMLCTISVDWNRDESAESIAYAACQLTAGLPQYKPDGAGMILIFHTESGCHVLGGVRENPALKDAKADDGSAYPLQMTTTLGGRVTTPDKSLKDLLVEGARGRMLPAMSSTTSAEGSGDTPVLEKLLRTLPELDGWEKNVCIHTDKWHNQDGSESTMCYLTATKHIRCSDAQLVGLEEALASSMDLKRSQGENVRTLMSFRFAKLDSVVANACATYALDERAKAETAWRQYGAEVAVTFNDLAVATLAMNGALLKEHPAISL